MKKERGITLIVLIIIIIVLLILAGINFNIVVGDNGILDSAGIAASQTDISDVKEQIWNEMIQIEKEREYTVRDVLEVAKEITGNDVDMENETVETAKGNIVDISDILAEAIVIWYYNDDGDVTNGSVTLAIGDIVYYNAVTNATTLSYTSYSTKNGSRDQTFTLEDEDTNYEWQVMGADEDTGELLIVLSNNTTTEDKYLYTDSGTGYYLSGKNGYANCITELDNICNLFGQGEGATGARSITVEDVNKLTGYDPETANYGSGTINEYGNEVTYTKNSNTGYIDYQGTKYPTDLTTQESYSIFTYYTGSEWKTLVSGESATVTSDYYICHRSINPSDMVYASNGTYWLASLCVVSDSGFSKFGCRVVEVYSVTNMEFFRSMRSRV